MRDYALVVIGSGPSGRRAAIQAVASVARAGRSRPVDDYRLKKNLIISREASGPRGSV